MTLTPEEVQELKNQLKNQIKDYPDQQRLAAEQQIDSMSDEAIETMLEEQKSKAPQKAIFRSIIDGDIPAKKIDENKQAIAVLDIKPISKGHSVIIPRRPSTNTKELPQQALSLAKKISSKIMTKLKAQGTEIQTEFKFGEVIINVIPIYEKPLNLNSQRYDASQEELEEVYQKLRKKEKKMKTIRVRKKTSKTIKLKRRIP